MKSGVLLSLLITWFSLQELYGQTVQNTYRFYEDLKVSAPECGPDLVPVNNPGSCSAGATGGDYPDDSPPCRVQRKVYHNAANWGLAYSNSEGIVGDTYTIQMYLKITDWGPARSRILDFSNGTDDEGIYFTKASNSDERCLNLAPAGVTGECPFFNANNYYLLTFTRNGLDNKLNVYVNDKLFIRHNDAAGKYTGKAGVPINIFTDDNIQSCETGRANFAYLAFNNKYTTEQEVSSNYGQICFTANINSAADYSIDPNPSCGFPENITVTYTGSVTKPGTDHKFEWDWGGATVVSGKDMGPFVVNWATPGPKNVSLTVTNLKCNNLITNSKIATISSLDLSAQVTNPTCTDDLGTIAITAIDGKTPFQYSIDSVNYYNTASFRVPADRYRVFVKDAIGCISARDVVIFPVETITVQTVGDTTVCEGQSVPLFTSSNATSFSWLPATDLDDASVKDPIATPNTTTEYIITADKDGCVVKDTVRITVIPTINLIVTPDTEIESEVPFQLEAHANPTDGNSVLSYRWSPPTGLNDQLIQNPVATLLSNQTYTVRGTSVDGCFAEARVKLTVIPPDWINIPTAFSPNGDGKNDILNLYTKGISDFHYFKIYNRWGQLVFHTTQIEVGWDGRFKGAEPVSGVYTYELMGTTSKGKIIKKEGSVLLLR
ncbi:gliding motility-associated C-terminal domain-containing protein [Dyadobacter sp. CY312]|uniref:T9SS type B sorting domain-containing protein n=1 Tax=Dyadobacter sp. CY312 TaxID=2907303 RepID=UPI001F1A7314|nr:gliding motility-associated C-terminal domain-containing protein [Dyadobacter sp. CY312]MCE7040199.1 gliding motility-associated C-terminal domain-containing protein [Dyadobacter sp. CY312]